MATDRRFDLIPQEAPKPADIYAHFGTRAKSVVIPMNCHLTPVDIVYINGRVKYAASGECPTGQKYRLTAIVDSEIRIIEEASGFYRALEAMANRLGRSWSDTEWSVARQSTGEWTILSIAAIDPELGGELMQTLPDPTSRINCYLK